MDHNAQRTAVLMGVNAMNEAAHAEVPGTIPGRSWTDVFGSELRLAATGPSDGYSVLTAKIGPNTAGVALASEQLRELGAECFERADHLDNVPGRNRRTWRWHMREGERLLSQSRDAVEPTHLIQRAHAHFTAAGVLRGHTSIQIHQHDESGKDTE